MLNKYKLYGVLHKIAKTILRKKKLQDIDLFYYYGTGSIELVRSEYKKKYALNIKSLLGDREKIPSSDFFFGENYLFNVNIKRNTYFKHHKKSSKVDNHVDAWWEMLNSTTVGPGYENSGFNCTGYILNTNQYCLSSWIWTSAAVARCYINFKMIEKGIKIGDAFLQKQLAEGGWIVRYDYSGKEVIPVVAPNDSAYIANNCILELYKNTGEQKYLLSAIKCADWIISSAKSNGLVYFGYNWTTKEWIKNVNIVDVGFTAALFAKLYKITNDLKYKQFLAKFINKYIDSFFNYKVGAFSTSIDSFEIQRGGFFARGQAWALEGLIPAYEILKEDKLLEVINKNVDFLVRNQLKNGGWVYNFKKPLMGEDNKGVPIIAKALLNYHNDIQKKPQILNSVNIALKWCENHTNLKGNCVGGIFSYNIEGAVIHDFYTSTAFTYSSAYALEINKMIGELL